MTDTVDRQTGEVIEATDNLRHWRSLGTTDPAMTTKFKRSGGFEGTATKPIWTEWLMTHHFGPCGIGWGTEKPEFERVVAGDEVLVFCTLGLWYYDDGPPRPGEVKSSAGPVYGVGGDKVVIKQSNGLRANDEAYKAAYTDALSNAMKHIGVLSDIHMGLFEDSKYVREASAAYAQEPAPRPPAHGPPNGNAAPAAPLTEEEGKRARAKMAGTALRDDIDACETAMALDALVEGPVWKEAERIMRDIDTKGADATMAWLKSRADNRRTMFLGGQG
jgi:hypothetical protein